MKKLSISIISMAILTIIFSVFHPAAGTDVNTTTNEKRQTQMIRTPVFAGGCFWCTEADTQRKGGK
jgi:hypothetical protein